MKREISELDLLWYKESLHPTLLFMSKSYQQFFYIKEVHMNLQIQ